MSDTDSKILMLPESNSNCAEMVAMLNNNGNNWMNNPFMYLIWLAFFSNGGFGFGNNRSLQGAELSGQVAQLQSTITDNHNNNLAMQAIQGNASAIHELANNLNINAQSLTAAIGNLQTMVGMSGKDIINGILLGNKDLMQLISTCCCENKQLVTTMGYETQLRDQANTAAITGRIDQLSNGIQTGFAQVGYNQLTIKSELLQNANANTQRIVDTLNNHWTTELQLKYADAKLELSQQTQNAYLISQLKTT